LPRVKHSRGGCPRKFSAKGYTIPDSMGNEAKKTGLKTGHYNGENPVNEEV
jgi:hypothetical protein